MPSTDREEVQRLISNPVIPEPRRVFYAILSLAGLRFDEAAALCWKAHDASRRPSSRQLVSGVAYDSANKREKSVKS